MTQTIWQSTAVHIGADAAEMFEAGVYILFGLPVPDALAEVSLVHDGPVSSFTPVQVGDQFCIADSCATITGVGSLVNQNLQELGHFVIYLNVDEADLLPGAVKGQGSLVFPSVGDRIEIRRSQEG